MSGPKYRQMADQISRDITAGFLNVGDKLPSTTELRETYQVSATVVNQAVLVLESRGIIEGVPGVGRFVKAKP
jgi:GntR family transcriptional regulator